MVSSVGKPGKAAPQSWVNLAMIEETCLKQRTTDGTLMMS